LNAIQVREFGPPEVMQIEDVPALHVGPGQVVVRVKAAGVNPVDTYIRSGMYARKPSLPWTPGSDAGGEVESAGEAVTRVSVGARVYVAGSMTGTYAEQVLCEEFQVHPLLDALSFEQGAAIGIPYATAYRALFQRANAASGEWILVHGATGGVGIATVQLAHAAGMKVIGTGGTEKGITLVKEQGADHALNHHDANYLGQVQALTGGHGVDVILEMLANVNLDRDFSVLAARGRVVIIGSRGRIEIAPRDIMSRDATVEGMLLTNATKEELSSIHTSLHAGFRDGTLVPIVNRQLPLTDAPQAHHEVMKPGAFGKIVLKP